MRYRVLVKFNYLHEVIWKHFNQGRMYDLGLQWRASLGGLPRR